MSTPLWTSSSAEKATQGSASGTWQVSGISIDSRAIAKGDLFIAIQGEKFDAHAFCAQALKDGASACMIAHRPADLAPDAPVLMVKDTMVALEDLARTARDRFNGKIIGVTGSVGKTGVKEALRQVLAAQGRVHANLGNLNNHIGAPLTLARMDKDCDFGVIELGMNHAGELHALSNLVRPDVSLITTVEAAHLEYFANVEAIADAKSEIFDGMKAGATVVLNRDNPHFDRLAAKAESLKLHILSFGIDPRADFCALESHSLGLLGTDIQARCQGKVLSYRISHPGRHWIGNSLAVLAGVAALGGDVEQASESLGHLDGLKGRGQRHTINLGSGSFTLIDESYNANAASMRAALAVLAETTPNAKGRKIAVLGDMLELGGDEIAIHRDLSNAIIANGIDQVFTCGPLMGYLRSVIEQKVTTVHADTAQELAPRVCAEIRPDDIVMVKSSNGSRTSLVVSALLALDSAPGQAPATAKKEN